MIHIVGRHIVVEAPDAVWRSEAIDLGRDNGAVCTVTVIASDDFGVVPELWGSNQRSQGFSWLAAAAIELLQVGESVTVQAAPVGSRYLQLRFGVAGTGKGDRIVVAATLETYRA